MNSDDEKSPYEEIDEEEKKNSPVKDTQELLEHEKEKEKKQKEKKEKLEKEAKNRDNKTEEEKQRDVLRCQIDMVTYQHRLIDLEDHLEMEKKRSYLKIEKEIDELQHTKKKQKITQDISLLKLQLEFKQKEQEWSNWVNHKQEYLLNPVRLDSQTDEVELVLSDRIIELSGSIVYDTSTYITERIDYYNNQSSEYPIFLVIDYCPGGSVISGYRIVKAIDSSLAPVYVVVKSFAASMAAVITTMAKYSFVYPNAIIMHHQMSRFSPYFVNVKQTEEQLDEMLERWRRLAEPVAKKLGYTLTQWRKMMYEKNSDGDWLEYGDDAVNIGWASSIVHRIRHTEKIYHPDAEKTNNITIKKKSSGCCQSSILPKLLPMDCYWIYNLGDYYKVETDDNTKY